MERAAGIEWPHGAFAAESSEIRSVPLARRAPPDRTKEVDGVTSFYREAGQDPDPVAVLLHGFPTSPHTFRNLIRAIADRYRVGKATCLTPQAYNAIEVARLVNQLVINCASL